MKSIKEKAKAYDEALSVARKTHQTQPMYRDWLEKMFPELKESEDERIRKSLLAYIKGDSKKLDTLKWISWLEKQGEHAKFRDSIQIGDKVTRNQDGVLVNLSQLNRVAKKQGEQKSNPCDGCINRKGCINCENGELRETEQKPAWSEEDEKQARQIERIVHDDGCTQKLQKQIADWFKSLKERYTWRPSDEQMNALNYVVNLMASSERPTENDLYYNILKSLRQQLKKLKD